MGEDPRDARSGQSKLHDDVSSTVPVTGSQPKQKCRHLLVYALNASEEHTGNDPHQLLPRRGLRCLGHCGGKHFPLDIFSFSECRSMRAHFLSQSDKMPFKKFYVLKNGTYKKLSAFTFLQTLSLFYTVTTLINVYYHL